MNKKVQTKYKNIISLKDLVKIFIKKKWLFIGFFLIILIIGLLITFLKTPVFQSQSILKLGDVYYEDNLYKYYPEEAKDLSIFAPGLDIDELKSSTLVGISKGIRSDELLEKVFDKVNIDIEKVELRETLRTFIDRGNKIVKVVITYSDAEDSFLINQTFINTYLSDYIENKAMVFDNLVQDIDLEIQRLEEEIAGAKSENGDDLNNEAHLKSREAILFDLDKIKYNLENNQELYISNIEIIEEPIIPSEPINADYLKNVIIVIFASIVAGLIAVYIPNIFTSLKD